jgi:hypothetical protein
VSIHISAETREGFSHREADAKSLLDEAIRRGIDERKATAIDGLLQGGDQAAAVLVAADVGQSLLAWLADFFS